MRRAIFVAMLMVLTMLGTASAAYPPEYLNDGDLILSGFPSISIETIRSGHTSSRMSRAVRSLTARSWRGTSRTARNSTVMLIRRISKTRFIGAWTMLDASRD